MKQRKHFATLIKFGITAVTLALVLSQVDGQRIWANLRQAQPAWLGLTFGVMVASVLVRAYRWQLLLRALGATVPFRRLASLYFAAGFFNSVLPFGVAGDVVRVVEVAREVRPDLAAGTVIADRLTGLLALFGLALVALPFRPAGFDGVLLGQIVLLCVVGLLLGGLLIDGRLVGWFGRRLPALLRPLWGKVEQLLTAVEACGRPAIGAALAVSLLFNLMQIVWWWAAGQALGYQIPPMLYFFTTPLMAVVILLPSIGGLGPREMLAPLLFAAGGLTAVEAVALSLLVFALERVSGLLGAPIYLLGLLRPQVEAQNITVSKL